MNECLCLKKVNWSGPKEWKFNEQLLLAELKMSERKIKR